MAENHMWNLISPNTKKCQPDTAFGHLPTFNCWKSQHTQGSLTIQYLIIQELQDFLKNLYSRNF
jgi:hypothetical protein